MGDDTEAIALISPCAITGDYSVRRVSVKRAQIQVICNICVGDAPVTRFDLLDGSSTSSYQIYRGRAIPTGSRGGKISPTRNLGRHMM